MLGNFENLTLSKRGGKKRVVRDEDEEENSGPRKKQL